MNVELVAIAQHVREPATHARPYECTTGSSRVGNDENRTAHSRVRAAAPPPALRREHRMLERPLVRERLNHRGQRRRARIRPAHIERARLIVAGLTGHERVPVVRAEERPAGDGAQIDPVAASAEPRLPCFVQPAHLLLARASDVALGDRHRPPIALPALAEQTADPRAHERWHLYLRHVGVHLATVSSDLVQRVALHALIEMPDESVERYSLDE